MNFRLTLKALIFLAIGLSGLPLAAQTPAGPGARITFGDDSSIILHGHRRGDEISFSPVEIGPGEQVRIQLRLPSRFANALVGVQALDGGRASGDVVVAADGTAAIGFQSGARAGRYRVLLSAGGKSATLKFSVTNLDNP